MLHKKSFHAPQVFNGIPKCQLMRARRICSSQSDYDTSMRKIIKKFEKRVYSRAQLIETGQQVAQMSEQELHKRKNKNQTNELL